MSGAFWLYRNPRRYELLPRRASIVRKTTRHSSATLGLGPSCKKELSDGNSFLLGWRPVSALVFRLVSLLRKNLPRGVSVLFVFAFFFFNNSLYWDLASPISASVKDRPASSSVEPQRPRVKSKPARTPPDHNARWSRNVISFWERTVHAGSSEEDLERWHAQLLITPCHP